MIRTIVALLGAVLIVGAAMPAMGSDCKGCKKVAKRGEGFCCGKGKAFGVELSSKKLYTALAGQPVNTAKMECAGCKIAAKTNGRCSHCNIGIVNGKAFHSTVSYQLAKGIRVTAEKAAGCSGCKTAHKSNGRCKECNVGFVGGRKFKNTDDYQAALLAYKTLMAAAEKAEKCEACAVAMVTDGECANCKVKFKNGKKADS